MDYKLQDLIDLEQFQNLRNRLNETYPFTAAIIVLGKNGQKYCPKIGRDKRRFFSIGGRLLSLLILTSMRRSAGAQASQPISVCSEPSIFSNFPAVSSGDNGRRLHRPYRRWWSSREYD